MTELDIERARRNMISQQVRAWEVLNQRVLEMLEQMPRERFTPERYRTLAYSDTQIPLAHGEVMMEPKVEGRLLQALDIQPGDRVLEIGTGTGYLTACLANLAGSVHSVEIHEDFLDPAAGRLRELGIENVTLDSEDAARGFSDPDRRFDAIAVTGSLPTLHYGFHRSLEIGGRLFVIVGTQPIMEALLITRMGEQEWSTESLFETDLPALRNLEAPSDFSF
ncbi:MAG TPA: protein-L-isoaspartate O-methyltransferase [Gammaproteobacteria bacterium]|nr:protein-L-isoaspartate O-methyltransferase [Gammaproteobacteria bacterium]